MLFVATPSTQGKSLMALAKLNPSGAGAKGGSAMTAGTMVLQYSSSAAVLDHLVGGACVTRNSGKRGPLNRWLRSVAVACLSHDRAMSRLRRRRRGARRSCCRLGRWGIQRLIQ